MEFSEDPSEEGGLCLPDPNQCTPENTVRAGPMQQADGVHPDKLTAFRASTEFTLRLTIAMEVDGMAPWMTHFPL